MAGLALAPEARAQDTVTGLDGFSLFIDPGHNQRQNLGVFNYSEAEKSLRVGLQVREILRERTDIDTVYLSRTNDQQSISLSDRVSFANRVAPDFFQSVHSNAAGPTARTAFVLWPQRSDGAEPTPSGGRAWAETQGGFIADLLRFPLSNNGAWGECDFYGASSCRSEASSPKASRNFVQGYTEMPSVLSETGFHTNPEQNQLNMNAAFRRLQAKVIVWTLLDYTDIPRYTDRMVYGIITDSETGEPLNGITVTIGDATYTTDTYASTFGEFDPGRANDLRNGFYFFDDLPDGELTLTVEADGFEAFTTTVEPGDTLPEIRDLQLVSTALPVVESTTPEDGTEEFRIVDSISLNFSRAMNTAASEAALSITPAIEGRYIWFNDDFAVRFQPDGSWEPETSYTLTVGPEAEAAAGYAFDADGDGEPGGTYSLTFETGPRDIFAPALQRAFPANRSSDNDLRPVITLTFDEPVDPASATADVLSLTPTAGGDAVPGTIATYTIGEGDEAVGSIAFFPSEDLATSTRYTFRVGPGLRDGFGNEGTSTRTFSFTTGTTTYTYRNIDTFEGGVANWWEPQQSGSTVGIATTQTERGASTEVTNGLTGSTGSYQLDYGWNTSGGTTLIRAYLGGGAPRNVFFPSEDLLQVYLFGDGSGTEFRFAVDDNGPGSHEVSPWTKIDWVGWRLVTWDLGADVFGAWVGDEKFDGNLRIDSFQFRYGGEGAAQSGTLFLDDLRLAEASGGVAVEPGDEQIARLSLASVFPNPFATTTNVRFDLPGAADVRLTAYDALGRRVGVLAERAYPGGTHTLTWDASALPSGVYLLRLEAGSQTATTRAMLVR